MTDQQMENLFYENEFFILRTARIATGRPITKSDDEWSVALSAFWEALKSHDPQKGNPLLSNIYSVSQHHMQRGRTPYKFSGVRRQFHCREITGQFIHGETVFDNHSEYHPDNSCFRFVNCQNMAHTPLFADLSGLNQFISIGNSAASKLSPLDNLMLNGGDVSIPPEIEHRHRAN